MSKKIALMTAIGLAAGVNISSLFPEPSKPKEITQHDLDRIAKAEEKRNRRRAKRMKEQQQ